MTDLLVTPNIETARQQFEATGHVLVPDAYDADMSPAIVEELDAVMRYQRPHMKVLGEQQTSVESRGDYLQQPHLRAMLRNIGERTLLLTDQAVWPVPEPDNLRVTRIVMQAGVKGGGHFDCPSLRGVVAITTPEGASKLSIVNADGSITEYKDIVPGKAVFLDTAKRFWHHAEESTGLHRRFGIIMARSSRG